MLFLDVGVLFIAVGVILTFFSHLPRGTASQTLAVVCMFATQSLDLKNEDKISHPTIYEA